MNEQLPLNNKMAELLSFGSELYSAGTFGRINDSNQSGISIAADNTLNLTFSTHSMFIYTDIVKMTLVGNDHSPL